MILDEPNKIIQHLINYEDKIEDVEIYFRYLRIQIVDQVHDDLEITAFTEIWKSIVAQHYTDKEEISGDLYIIFRNQSVKKESAILVTSNFEATSKVDREIASIFNKVAQFVFIWFKEVVENKKLDFIVPDFQYSKYHH